MEKEHGHVIVAEVIQTGETGETVNARGRRSVKKTRWGNAIKQRRDGSCGTLIEVTAVRGNTNLYGVQQDKVVALAYQMLHMSKTKRWQYDDIIP